MIDRRVAFPHTRMHTDEVFSVIADLGTQTSRFGYAGEDCPKAVFPSVRLSAQLTDRLTDPSIV